MGWKAGADDYVRKPFSPRSSPCRPGTRTQMARTPAPCSLNGDLMIDIASRRVYLHGSALDISDTEVRFLVLAQRLW